MFAFHKLNIEITIDLTPAEAAHKATTLEKNRTRVSLLESNNSNPLIGITKATIRDVRPRNYVHAFADD